MNTRLRNARPEDAETAGRICFEAFGTIARAHNFPRDIPSAEAGIGLVQALIARDDVYSVIAEREGRILGSNFLWETAPVSGVGPITIDPAAQNGGVGRALMENVLERAREQKAAGVRLVQAAYHGRSLSLYTKLGFDAREPLSILQGPALNARIPGCEVRPATDADVAGCNALSVRVHGFARSTELSDAIRQGTAMVVERQGRISGYATSLGFFGHAVGETGEEIKALIGAAPAFLGPGFLLPTRNAAVFRWCLENGLHVVQPMTLMSLGLYNEPAGAFLPSIIY